MGNIKSKVGKPYFTLPSLVTCVIVQPGKGKIQGWKVTFYTTKFGCLCNSPTWETGKPTLKGKYLLSNTDTLYIILFKIC